MTPENFVYWLQGHLEIGNPQEGMTPEQVKIIQDHINLVLKKVTPGLSPDSPGLPHFCTTDPNTSLIC